MKRYQLAEFCDQSWLPSVFREAFHDCLGFVQHVYRPYQGGIKRILDQSSDIHGGRRVYLDLASGGAEHVVTLHRVARNLGFDKKDVPKFILSDLYPLVEDWKLLRQEFGEDCIDYMDVPVSVSHVPARVSRHWMVVSSFHHFSPSLARQLIEQAVGGANSLHILEYTRRHWPNIFATLLCAPTYTLSPFFARRFSFAKLLITTLVPIVPIIVAIDGIVSCLRSYKPEEIIAMLPEDARALFRVEYHEPRFPLTPFKTMFFSLYRIHPLPDNT